MEATIERLEITDVSIPPSFALVPALAEQRDVSGGVEGDTEGEQKGLLAADANRSPGELLGKGTLQGLQLSSGKVVEKLGGKTRSFALFAQALRSTGHLVHFALVERPEVRLLLLEVARVCLRARA